MSRFLSIGVVLVILVGAMGFASANAGHRVTLDLGLFTLYRVPVTLVAFSGLLTGMVVMFLTGIHTDLKVRRILRERLREEVEEEKHWIDKNQQDLFSDAPVQEKALEDDGLRRSPGPESFAPEGPTASPVPPASEDPPAKD